MNSRFCLYIQKDSLYYFLMVIPFTPIEYINSVVPAWGTFCSAARILVIAILLIRLFFIQHHFPLTLWLAIMFFVGAFISTYFAKVSFYTLLYNCTYLFGWTLLIEDGVNLNIDAFVRGVLFWFELLIYSNLLFSLFLPNGYKPGYYLLGNYNTVMRKLFPGIIFGLIYAIKSKGKITIRFACSYLALLLFFIRVGSMTSIIGTVIFGIGILFYMIVKRGLFFKFEYFLIISIILTIIFAIMRQFDFAENLLTGVLGKDMTLSTRTRVWARTISRISNKPILGYGQLSRSYTTTLLGGAIDPHNIFLGTLFYGGVVGLAILGIILFITWRKIRKCRKELPIVAFIFDIGICAYFIIWNFEPFAGISEFYKVFIFFALACNCSKFAQYIMQEKDKILNSRLFADQFKPLLGRFRATDVRTKSWPK